MTPGLDADEKSLIAFSTIPGIGPARLKLLINYFHSAENAWQASDTELQTVGLPKDVLFQLLQQKKLLNLDQYIENLSKRNIKFITIGSPDYPDCLRNIPNPPLVLYIKSNLTSGQFKDLTLKRIIGIVGTRKITNYGQEVTANLTSELVAAGFTIVSGMALGVDGVAHRTTLNLGGKTIAVLGAGVEIIYPREHTALYNSILEHDGAIVSEVAPEKTVIKGVFPARNRIISGLSQAVLVTEGAIDSGSLITARAALEQGREVFAVPGPINSPMAEGTNYLLKQGAKLVTGVTDILQELGYESNQVYQGNQEKKMPKGETEDEQKIIDLLINEPKEFDELAQESGIVSEKLGATLTNLEIGRKIRSSGLIYSLS